MANILLVDPDPIAQRAMKGILARGSHRFAAVTGVTDARHFLHRNAPVDLVILEATLNEEETGLTLIQELRRDCFLHAIPITVYASSADRDSVRQALALHVQNFLVKPYVDAAVFGEINKAIARPWREALCAPEKLLCAQLGLPPAEARGRRRDVLQSVTGATPTLLQLAEAQNRPALLAQLEQFAEEAIAVGAHALVTFLETLQTLAESQAWSELNDHLSRLASISGLMKGPDDPEIVPEGFTTEEERRAQEVAEMRATWVRAVAEGQWPVVGRAQLVRELDALPGWPILDSAAAAFQMAATGHPSSLAPLMDLAEKDPGLSAQLLIVTNKMKGGSADDPVESARLCIGLLGETRLSTLARNLVIADTTAVEDAHFSWAQFWKFQLGVARLARQTCLYLGLETLEIRAYTAGLLHDLGKLLLLHLHPGGLLAILEQSRHHQRPVREVEQQLLDWTTPEMAAHFAEQRGLPTSYCNVIRWIDSPAEAGPDAELVAIVSLARDLCLHNHVGSSGELPRTLADSIEETPQWDVLQSRIFPSFNLRKFEAQIHATCREMKRELSGQAERVCA